MIRRSFVALLCFLIAATLPACGNTEEPSDAVADQSYLYGMCYIAYESEMWNNGDYNQAFAVMKNLGVKSWRNWMHFDWVMSAPDVVDQTNYEIMRGIVDEAARYEFQVIGMNHHNFSTYGGIAHFDNKKPFARDMTENSDYRKWLNDYETSWYTLSGLFKDITLWEVENEPTNDAFMGLLDGTTLSLAEKAAMFADMLFYASKGIKRANPQAQVIAGGLDQVGSGIAASFTELLYGVIAGGTSGSTNPDDFFDCYAVHTYYNGFNAQTFKSDVDEIYDIIKQNDKPKKVYVTEAGWTEASVPSAVAAEYILQMYQIAQDMPYVESIHYFRLLDDTRDAEWSSGLGEVLAGMFIDPDPTADDSFDGTRRKPGSPKATAYAYQTAAGGEGDLTIMEKEPL